MLQSGLLRGRGSLLALPRFGPAKTVSVGIYDTGKGARLEQGPCRNTVVPRFTARAVPGRRDRGWVTLMMIHRTRRDATAGTSAGNWGNAPSGVWKSHSDRTRYASQSRAAALKDTVWKPSGPGISRRT